MSCAARQYGGEMECARCGLRWDVADVDRPACNPVGRSQLLAGAPATIPQPRERVDVAEARRKMHDALEVMRACKWKEIK